MYLRCRYTMIIMIFIVTLTPVDALIGFDCGGQNLNVTSISLLGANDCNLDIKATNSSKVYIQLLQLSDYNYAEVIQCKVVISRIVYYCGMHSHVSPVHNGHAEYLEETMGDRCLRMHRDGSLRLGADGIVTGIKKNQTTTYPVVLVGSVDTNGKCQGAHYNDQYGAWDNVFVQAIARITLRSSYVPVHLNSGKIYLKSGAVCELKEGSCIDPDFGYTFWKPMPVSSCDFHQYDVLYEGSADKTTDESLKSHTPVIYSLTTRDITFALMITNEQQLCGYRILRTEHPKLFIVETRRGDVVKTQTSIPVDNLDIFAYVNSKFVYVEKHVRNQMTSLYYNIMQQRCELEREVMKNTLSLATLLPDEFAYRLMKNPGYMAVTAGEAVHVVKCIPVDVVIRKTKECYNELPVTARNASLFLTPRSRILSRYGTQRECSHELPVLYQIENMWVQFTPEPQQRQLPPQKLQPMTKISWNYLTPGPLAMSGIYSEQDINKLREHIMFPAEKPALLNSLARGITGYTTGPHTASMYDLLNEEALEKIAQSTAHRLWAGFVTFGSATAGVLGIFIIIRVIKIIIDTAIHGYALHMAYGCSLHLLGAIWSSLTHLLLHLAHGPRKGNKQTTPPAADGRPGSEATQPRSADQPVVPVTETTTYVNMQPYMSTEYLELNKRLNELEQIPMSPSGLCSTNRGEM